MTNLPKCPHCYSFNIYPIGTKLWHCNDCGKDFNEAVVDMPTEETKKGGKS